MNRSAVMHAIRQPQSAAIAGLVFGGILAAIIILLHSSAPILVEGSADWVDDHEKRNAVSTALNLIPFAGIAFLWFIAVIRAQLGSREDRFFETVFLGSGLLFIALLFTTAAVLKAVLVSTEGGMTLPDGVLTFAWTFAAALLRLFGARMAAVFIFSVATTGVRLGTIPRWLAIPGYLTGLLLLATPPMPSLAQLLFPLWVIALSVHILVRGRTPAPDIAGDGYHA
jgi:hypothetical protein